MPERASEIAHELRTQLAIIGLRLATIDDPRAKEAEKDIHALSASVDELSCVISRARGQSA